MNKSTTVWIIGASTGIGEALVLNWAKRGATVIISSRSKKSLEAVKERCGSHQNNVIIETLDLENSDSIVTAADNVLKNISQLDYVFLNGGLSQRALVHETGLETDRKLMEVNYFGNVILAKKILPYFLKQGYGHFTVTSSFTGVMGIPFRSSYAAAKHALHGFFDSLRAEYVKEHISVTIVCPGYVKTNISVNAIGPGGIPTGVMDPSQNTGMLPEKCAQKMIDATIKREKEVYFGGKEVLMIYFKKYLPFLYYKFAAGIKSK
jgi:short-subunit dehydrogenase